LLEWDEALLDTLLVLVHMMLFLLSSLLFPKLIQRLLPAIIALSGAQGQHPIDILKLPLHARAFQACLDDTLIRTFDHTRTNWPSFALISWILHHGLSLLQIAQFLTGKWAGIALTEMLQIQQDSCWPVMLESM
jgi:hypothetical protein